MCIPKYNLLTQIKEHHTIATIKPTGTLYSYRFIVYSRTENGIDTPTIACVEGIPYSRAHLLCSLTTGGPGLDQQRISLMLCPKKYK